MKRENKFWLALGIYAVIGAVELATLEGKIRLVALVILAFFAVRTLVRNRRAAMEEQAEAVAKLSEPE